MIGYRGERIEAGTSLASTQSLANQPRGAIFRIRGVKTVSKA